LKEQLGTRDRSLPIGCPPVRADESVLTIRLGISPRPTLVGGASAQAGLRKSLRKEVIQPQVLLRLPCYDLVPVTELAVDTTELWRLRALPAPMT
jgi:hypothetical protein